jgi:hypothetical protein
MTEEWPVAAPQSERAAEPVRRAGRERLHTVIADFFLDSDERLTEQERALMNGMLAGLLGGIADEIRAVLPPALGAANDEDGFALVKTFGRAGLLDRTAVIGLLLRRTEEERIAVAVRSRTSANPIFLQALIAGSDEHVSAAAMDLILARGRRRDPFGQLKVDFDDLPADVAAPLVYAVAAALRSRLMPAAGDSSPDRELADAAATLIARHDEGRSAESLTAALVRALVAGGRLDEPSLMSAAQEGDAALVVEALAQRAGIECAAAWDNFIAGSNGRLALLLKMTGVSREFAANLLAHIGDLLGISDLGREIERFDSLDLQQVWDEQEQLRLNPDYRAALANLGGTDG